MSDEQSKDGEEIDTFVDEITTEPASKLHGYLTIIGGICLHFFCGQVQQWGNISNYVISYFHNIKGDDWATEQVALLIIPLTLLFESVFYPIGCSLFKRVNPKLLILCGSIVINGSLLLASICTKMW